MKPVVSYLSRVLVIAILSSCQSAKNSSPADGTGAAGTAEGITEKYWKLTELRGKAVPVFEGPGREPHFILKNQDNRLSGSGGCNRLMGGYELQPNNRIRFTKVASTRMACPDMTVEQEFMQVLNTADSYVQKGDTLILNRARIAPLARFVAVYF
ncbi:META domain-containing protein [Larkinella soli]|uniref:META domain-containing protein n=1 Tax=Larkinella soli TaxID=1770527 RepID=UPI000FFB2323|nr:META domain-containing protein [Larkinella soli]